MKITALKKYKTKLLKIKLLEMQAHKNFRTFNFDFLKNLEIKLKKALYTIHKFHVANKKILFIGTPLTFDTQIKQLLTNKKHVFIPKNIWINGIVTNPKSSFVYLTKQNTINTDKTFNFLFSLKNQADLIVILDEKTNIIPLKEISSKQIPTISLNTNYNLSYSTSSTYKVTGDYSFSKTTLQNNLIFLLLSSTLKKAEQVEKRLKRTQKNQLKKKIRKPFFTTKKNAVKKKK